MNAKVRRCLFVGQRGRHLHDVRLQLPHVARCHAITPSAGSATAADVKREKPYKNNALKERCCLTCCRLL
jgi:hypothetical protein